jgi:hypothetical protein
MPAVRHLRSQLRPLNQESGPNASVQCRGPIWKDSHQCSRVLPTKRYLLIAIDYFTTWPEAYTTANQEALTATEVLVTNFFCCFGVSSELHSDQGHNFESRLIQKVLHCLGLSKTHTIPLHPQSDGMVEHYIRTIKVITSHQRDWDSRLLIFLLAYKASTHDTTRLKSASLVFGRELRLPCSLVFGVSPRQWTIHSWSCGKFGGPPTRHP